MGTLKVAVGLSGGVDSSVAAHMLQEMGYEVIGVTMKVCDTAKYPGSHKSACFGGGEDEDIEKAASIAAQLQIPFHIVDLADQYEELIINYFKNEYLAGRTPNPCVRCNAMVKFGLLPAMTKHAGVEFDYFATGHYVQVEFDEHAGRHILKKGKDAHKDQSYFLSMLTQETLGRVIFPLGSLTKGEVRERARKAGLLTAEREESQDFYGGEIGDLFKGSESSGQIRTADGRVIGTHGGLYNFTIGKRRGIGQTTGEKLYVVGIDGATKTVIAGDESQLYSESCLVSAVNWVSLPEQHNEFHCSVRVRYRHAGSPARVIPLAHGCAKIIFDQPERSVTPGQYAVFYDDDRVIGAGVIEK